MYNYNQHLHFIGIGGVGMAGIAEVLLNLGYSVSGSDIKSNNLIERLEDLGANVAIGHISQNIPDNTSVVVLSSAITEDNTELIEAKKRKLPLIQRAEMLAELMKMKYGIAVAGSHGKTTTTSMTGKILTECGFDPTVIIGGRILSQDTGAKLGTGSYLVAEADESDGSFCLLKPAIAIITNIDHEHMNHYQTFGALENAFFEFMKSVPFYGLVVVCSDDPVLMNLAQRLERRVITYGLSPNADIQARNIEVLGPISKYDLFINDKLQSKVVLPMVGVHMVCNSLAAIAVSLELGGYVCEIVKALEKFPGVARRCELVSSTTGIAVIDDYGHHPKEISATLLGIKQGWIPYLAEKNYQEGLNPNRDRGRLIVIFQPHRYSRTKDQFTEFLSCFNDADILFINEIYSAGEEPIAGITAEKLAGAMHNQNVHYVKNLNQVSDEVSKIMRMNDVILTIGAGSIHTISKELKNILERN
ncbi:MAG: UDP-N-acetylmuramate--L-alanine ligase [Proteobacteria bacterium]|nr:UDP-N-acetylmuramate--L-alanine ligase [Pseudomonadota bacterium]